MTEQDSFTKRFRKDRLTENEGKGFSERFAKRNPTDAGESLAEQTDKENKSFAQDKVSKSRIMNDRSFAEATKRSRADCIFLVRGKDRGKAAWHYVLVDKDKKEMFLAKSKTGSIDVALYGQILHSGWGENPPQDIVDKINNEFGG